MKAAVLGIGRMGEAICYAMGELGFEVVGIDSNEHAVSSFRKHFKGPDGIFYATNQDDADKSMERALLFEMPDIVISSLPYHQTEEIAYWCISNGLRYCDLGGRVDVSHAIDKEAEKSATKPVFTDLGLAPGWVNILAEQGAKEIHKTPDRITMMVGGLPLSKVNHPLDYVITWSVDGLINEYKDDCEILSDGKIKTVEGMSGLETVDCGMLGSLEAFYTSGGASHTIHDMKERGVKNCHYKTLRYEGHRDIVRFLLRNSGDKCLREVFERGCQEDGGVGDLVIIKTLVEAGDISWKKELTVFHERESFSAMQKATAFPISAVASLMAEGKLEGDKEQRRDYHTQYPRALTYKDVPFGEFNDKLRKLGIDT